jgi:hypothetical protein
MHFYHNHLYRNKSYTITGLDRPFGLQEVKPRISRQSVQEGQPYAPATFIPRETLLVGTQL